MNKRGWKGGKWPGGVDGDVPLYREAGRGLLSFFSFPSFLVRLDLSGSSPFIPPSFFPAFLASSSLFVGQKFGETSMGFAWGIPRRRLRGRNYFPCRRKILPLVHDVLASPCLLGQNRRALPTWRHAIRSERARPARFNLFRKAASLSSPFVEIQTYRFRDALRSEDLKPSAVLCTI